MTGPSVLPRRRVLLLAAVVAAAVLAARLPLLLRSGGLFSAVTVDDGVHYAAAASLLVGRLPYRDFLFLHPPGIVLALTPFAAFGRLVGDADAFAAARAVFIVVGAATSGLAVLALRRFGALAAVVGGLVEGLAFPVVYAERSALLEVLGAAGLLGALALLAVPAARGRRVAAGVLLGAVAAVKLPFVLPAVIIALTARRRAGAVLIAAVSTAAAICLPFLLVAPSSMIRMVVLDQAGRRRIVPSLTQRLEQIFPPPGWPPLSERAAVVAMVALVGVLVVIGALTPGACRYAVLVVADTAMLLAGPSFYGHYAVLAALPAALLAGVAVGRVAGLSRRGALRRRGRPQPAVAAGLGVLAIAVVVGAWTPGRIGLLTTPAVDPSLTAAVRAVPGCTTSDVATALVLTGALTEQLERGCPLWPDVTGWQFEDRPRTGAAPPADRDPAYQRRALRYFRSGEAVLLVTAKDGLSAATRSQLRSGPLVWSGPRGSLHLVRR